MIPVDNPGYGDIYVKDTRGTIVGLPVLSLANFDITQLFLSNINFYWSKCTCGR